MKFCADTSRPKAFGSNDSCGGSRHRGRECRASRSGKPNTANRLCLIWASPKRHEHWKKPVYLVQVYDPYLETFLFTSGKDREKSYTVTFVPLKKKISNCQNHEVHRISDRCPRSGKNDPKLADKFLCVITVYIHNYCIYSRTFSPC